MAMRIAFAVLAVALVATPLAIADTPPEPRLVQLVAVDGVFAVLTWSPVAGADIYLVYRGLAEDDMALIGGTTQTEYFDDFAPADAIYGIVVVDDGQQSSMRIITPHGGKGDCVSANSNLHVSVTFANCIRN
jgi:hypothetical protein